jgi:mannose-6-phosphate isomerase-like protein (cupin superfamily)
VVEKAGARLGRRIVTGHDANGHSIVASDAVPPRRESMGPHGPHLYEFWNTRETPARIDRNDEEPPEAKLTLAPPRRGTRIRITDFEPESVAGGVDASTARKQFEAIGGGHAFTGAGVPRHPLMHRTESIDYGIVLEGEITLILDNEETVVRAGDIVVQRGTNHAWANRGKSLCRVAFVLIDGVFDDALAEEAGRDPHS